MANSKQEYKLQYPDLIQPRDKNHPLYQFLEDFIIGGDGKVIASFFEIKNTVVSDVKNGRIRSRRVWDKLIATAIKRKEQQDKVLSYAGTQIAPRNAA